MDDMNVGLWSRLPSAMVEEALSFLSVPVLCRFRTVCKSWNSLICKPEFRARCIRHERKDACFLVARYFTIGEGEELGEDDGLFYGNNHGWSFLDLDTRCWYTIKQDGQEVFDRFERGSRVAMDGGLVCQLLEADKDEDVSVFVSNPIAKTSKRLPTLPYSNCVTYHLDLAVVNMVVDNIAHYYKIFVMPNTDDGPELRSAVNPLMIIYESTTNQWRRSTHPPMPQITEDWVEVECSVFFDGMLYILMLPGVREPVEHRLWRYNHVNDTWNDTGVNSHLELAYPQLLVSDNRLFLGSWLRFDRTSRWIYEISEVNLQNRTRSPVFQWSGATVVRDFDVVAYSACSFRERHAPFRGLNAFGFCKSIVLLCESSGVSKVYDLSTCWWDLLPKNRLCPLPKDGEWLFYGKPMNLILPASTL